MTTFSIINHGCRATEADASELRRALLDRGLALAAGDGTADLVILNTCTVTAAADSQARGAIRKIHRENPSARLIVTGCYAQRAPQEIAAQEGVSLVVGNSHQADIPNLAPDLVLAQPAVTLSGTGNFLPLDRLLATSSGARGPAKILSGDIFSLDAVPIASGVPLAGDRTRPILKIQDGCNNRCSYCVIPFVRGQSRSLPPGQVLAGIRELLSAGAQEIVLSGINLGSYGREFHTRAELIGVVQRILAETSLPRLRLSSIEPQHVTRDFVALVASSPRIAPHFHVPLQSGSDRILAAMHRWYRAAHYAERIRMIRQTLPDAAIGADVIVGFPGESDEDFQVTLDFIERLPFTYLHVFSFSKRPGTKAAKLDSEVPLPVIRQRAVALRELARRKAAAFRSSQTQRVLRALTLNRGGDDWTEALTGNYLKVRIAGRHAANEWHEVRLGDRIEDTVDCSAPA
jgi:threonylcarbamoyladenosine tRNA methylthiotransferase MtaB